MISRLGQAMPRFFSGGHIAGDGLRERLRSSIFALFGVATAVGLILVGIAYNQGWPDFVDSPIPGLRSERVGDAAVVRDAATPQTRQADGSKSPGSTRAGPIGPASGPASDPRISSQQQLPAVAPDEQAPGTGPSGQGGAATPGSPAQAPAAAPPAAEPPTPADTQPAQVPAPVSTLPPPPPPAAEGSSPGNGKGKAKGHEKNGKSTPPAPVVPTASPEPLAPPPEPAPVAEAPGNGHGQAKGHSK